MLLDHELNVGEIVDAFGMGQPRISRHLKVLATAGLLDCRRDGLRVFYRAASAGVVGEFLAAHRPFLSSMPGYAEDAQNAQAAVRERTFAARRFFDAVADKWRDLTREVLGDFNLCEELAGRLHPGMIVADFGCGTGELLARLAEDARRVIGVDGSRRMLELATARLSGRANAKLLHGELERLPLRDGEVQAATLSLVLHHVNDPLAVLRETRRTLAAGGMLLVAEFDRHDNEDMRLKYGGARLGVDQETLYDWLRTAGFAPRRADAFSVNQGLTLLIAEAAVA
jgi:ArsR family transcriptional regulator